MPNRIDAAIFDLDGTLGDTMPILMQGLKDVTEEITGTPLTEADVVDRYGPPDHEVLADLLDEHPLSAEHEARYRQHVRHLASRVTPLPGMVEMLAEMQAAGVRTGVYSARGTAYAQIITAELGLAPHLDEVWGGDRVGRFKPDPAGILELLSHFDISTDNAIYVGDSVNDLLAADAAGVPGILVLWSSTPQPHLREQADVVVSTPAELLALVLGSR